LVTDVSDNGQLYYYCGYFKDAFFPKNVQKVVKIPANTNNYMLAMKIPYKEEAELICEKINEQHMMPFKYHVERHMYM